MADSVKFELVSPERLLKSVEAAHILVPGIQGDFGVLPGHSPLMSTLRPGMVEIDLDGGADVEKFFVKGGLAQIAEGNLTILAEEAIAPESVELEKLARQIKDTQEDIEDSNDEQERARLEKELAWMQALYELMN